MPRTGRAHAATARIRRWGFAIVAAAASVASAQMSVPPAEYRPAVAHKAEPAAALRLPQGGHVRRIALPLPTAAEAVAPKASARTGGANPLSAQQGPPAGARVRPGRAGRPIARCRSRTCRWQTTAAGTRAAQLALTSPGAAAVRLGLALTDAPPGLAVRFQGSVSGAPAFGPFTGAAIAGESPSTGHRHWKATPAPSNSSCPPAWRRAARALELPMISHLNATGRSLRAFGDNIGFAGACEVDIACLDPRRCSSSSRRRPTRSRA